MKIIIKSEEKYLPFETLIIEIEKQYHISKNEIKFDLKFGDSSVKMGFNQRICEYQGDRQDLFTAISFPLDYRGYWAIEKTRMVNLREMRFFQDTMEIQIYL